MYKKRAQGFGILAVVVAMAIVAIVGLAGWYVWQKNHKVKSINNFQECADAGYPIQESNPEVCGTPDGRSFTNTALIAPEDQNAQDLVSLPDEKISGEVPNPMTVVYLVQHRSALNGKSVVIKGEVILRITKEDCPNNSYLESCPSPRIVIGGEGRSSPTAGVSNPAYNVEIFTEKSDQYSVGQTVTITAGVTGDKGGLALALE